MNPKISVITVCYNEAGTIENTILSIIRQTYPLLEFIVVDGGSTDGTIEIIKRYNENITLWISEQDEGIFDAMNKGLALATGEWVVFMNAGDCFYNNEVIESVRQELRDDIVMVYGDTQYIRATGKRIEYAREPHFIQQNMPTCHQSFFVRTEEARKIGFDTRYKYAADYNMVYNIFMNHEQKKVKHLNIVVSSYEAITGLSMLHANEVYREVLSIRKFSLNHIKGYLKYFVKKIIGRK